MDGAVLSVDASPAAFGLERAMRRLEARPVRTGADAVRHLVEPVSQGLGPDLDRLKQDVVFGIARHDSYPPLFLITFPRRGRGSTRCPPMVPLPWLPLRSSAPPGPRARGDARPACRRRAQSSSVPWSGSADSCAHAWRPPPARAVAPEPDPGW